MDYEFNKTNICLIPKVQRSMKLADFRPISLCNVAYKIIVKVMANKMKKILPTVIFLYIIAPIILKNIFFCLLL